ncbi:MAG TPA: hypothetical protein VN947_13835 [Polyangia bacterium]|nr:hypothetical protein [Polyangia bacterium]
MRAALAGALLLAGTIAMASPRSDLARDFVAYLSAHGLEVTIARQTEDEVVLAIRKEKERIALENLEGYIADAVSNGASTAEARNQVFGQYLGMLKQIGHPPLTLAHDGARIMPRLVRVGSLPADKMLHAGNLGETGLEVTYVVDSETSVRYLNAADKKNLGLDDAGLRALALKNLERTMDRGAIRKLISGSGMRVVKMLDSYDAARLLLVQAALRKGESVAAVVTDRDTLVVLPAPANGDWSTIRTVAKIPPGDPAHPLLDRPLLVTPDKIEAK